MIAASNGMKESFRIGWDSKEWNQSLRGTVAARTLGLSDYSTGHIWSIQKASDCWPEKAMEIGRLEAKWRHWKLSSELGNKIVFVFWNERIWHGIYSREDNMEGICFLVKVKLYWTDRVGCLAYSITKTWIVKLYSERGGRQEHAGGKDIISVNVGVMQQFKKHLNADCW